jgi:hypothetical protein|tara:strand:- start:60 stop:335 length:276 start_codon:yes stop_codon:yes gene_type:complete
MIKRIPKRFYIDCQEVECLAPPIVRETKSHYFVDISKGDGTATSKDTMEDFISRAHFYEDEWYFGEGVGGICKSAKATLRALGEPTSGETL